MDRHRSLASAGSSPTSAGPGGDGKQRPHRSMDTDIAHLIVSHLDDTTSNHPQKKRNEVYRSLRQVDPAFYSQVPLKTKTTLGSVMDFARDYRRGPVRIISSDILAELKLQESGFASSVSTLHMPRSDDGSMPEALSLEELPAIVPNVSTMKIPMKLGDWRTTRYGVLCDEAASKPTLTIDCGHTVLSIDGLTKPADMTVLPFPYRDNLNIRLARDISMEYDGDEARALASESRSLTASDQPVAFASKIMLSCRSPASDPEDVLDVMRQLIKMQSQHGSVKFEELSLRLPLPTVDA